MKPASMASINRHRVLQAVQCIVCLFLCLSLSLWRSVQVTDQVKDHYKITTESRDFWVPAQPVVAKGDRQTKSRAKSSKKSGDASPKDYSMDDQFASSLDQNRKIGRYSDSSNDWQVTKTDWHNERPEISDLITDDKAGIVGDVRPLLDFAILGHAKCATSFLMKWLSAHPETQIWDYEVCILSNREPARLVRKLYEELPVGGQFKRGYKCPGHFSRDTLRYFRSYFGKSNVIVGLRHPVRWFESYYNFRIRRGIKDTNWTMPPANQLLGTCVPESHGVCTDRAQFHTNLAMFGKTNMTDPSEQSLLRLRDKYTRISQIDTPVFLYDLEQLYDDNENRRVQFQSDLQHFLGLSQPFPAAEVKTSSQPKEKAINICSDEYIALRNELIDIGKRASIWIRHYFLQSDQVFVSSREHFEDIVKQWEYDPCVPDAVADEE